MEAGRNAGVVMVACSTSMKHEFPNVTLVSLQPEEDAEVLPLGAGCIAAVLVRAHRVPRENIRLLASPVEASPELLIRQILAGNPDIVGFSLYCWNSTVSIGLAKTLKALDPGILIVAGGPDSERLDSADPEQPFDAVFLGEAEASFSAWWGAWFGAGRSGGTRAGRDAGHDAVHDAVRKGGLFVRSQPCDAAALPSPWLEGILKPKRGGAVAWELTRGCPFCCTYCYEGRGTAGLRHLPDSRIAAELELFVESGVSEVFVLDPTFNVQKGRALSLLRLIAGSGGGIAWNFEIRAELLDAAQAEAFASLPCSLQIGLQSASPEVLAKVGRDIDRKKFASRVGLLNAAGAAFGFDLIYGLPGDSLSGFRQSLDFALSLAPNHLDIFPLAVLPGTVLRDEAAEFGLDFDAEPPYLLRGQPGFPPADMAAAARLAKAATLFYTQGRAVPWFLALLKPLRMKPSDFLEGFSCPEASPARHHRDIEALQCGYIAALYEKRGKSALLPAALDLVRYHGAWSRAFAEGERSRLSLSFPLRKVEGAEMLDLQAFCARNSPEPCMAELRPTDRGPSARILRR